MRTHLCFLVALGAAIAGLAVFSVPAPAADATPDGKIYDMRVYKANPGKLDALHARFRDYTCKIFQKHGMELIAFWSPTTGEEAKDTLMYIVAFPNLESQKKAWDAFWVDPEWVKVKADSEKDGVLVKEMNIKLMRATDYSHTPAPAADAPKAGKVYELRVYHTNPGKLDALNARFRDHTCKLFQKHGMELIGFWTPLQGDEAQDTLYYILAFPSVEAQKKAWQAFGADPDWKTARTESEKDGVLVKKVESKILKPTDYSPMR